VGIVVTDTGPLQYLILIGNIDILPRLFTTVTAPAAVQNELMHRAAPKAVRDWAASPPSWLAVAPGWADTDPNLQNLGAGERAAILLAVKLKVDLLLMDDRAGVAAARSRGLRITGTLGVLELAARNGLIDLAASFKRLEATNFRRPPAILDAMLASWRRDRGR
jgi:predicted nucleic acid-binding protein